MNTLFEGLTEFCFVFRFGFCATLHVANRAVTLLLLLRRCMESFNAFCSEYSRARPSTACVCRSFHDGPCLLWGSAVRAQPRRLMQRLLGLFVAGCALVRADGLSAVSYDPLAHYRHSAGDRNVRVGHEISSMKTLSWFIVPINLIS